MAKLTCRLRKYRKSAQLSQRELTILLGLTSQGSFSEVESGLKRPSATVVLACEIVFGVPARELFPGMYAQGKRTVSCALRRLSKSDERGLPASPVFADLARRLETPA